MNGMEKMTKKEMEMVTGASCIIKSVDVEN